jgi:hypothetical protein
MPARNAAVAAYCERHPTAPTDNVQRTVALMISVVARGHPTWLWKGVGAGCDDCARAVQRLLEGVWRCVC